MVFINSEGKFNDNSYLIDGLIFRLPKQLAVYVIENKGKKLMIDTGVGLAATKILKKLKEYNLFPIDKLLLTHSHWDHVQGYNKLKKQMGDFETLASENAIDNLKNPEKLNKVFGYEVDPIENVNPIKEGDIIDLNGLELEIINLFGHTHDSIGVIDRKNKNIFPGDAIIDRYDYETVNSVFMPPDFDESALIKSFNKLNDMRNEFNSISLNHFGVWTDKDYNKILDEMEKVYRNTKDSIIKWYKENPSLDYITSKYHETFIPKSTIHTKENILGFKLVMEWLINGLKISGFIK
jgi:glyoxylase-like metal-dependent hydrolase (beta-lactamase superfamily II)